MEPAEFAEFFPKLNSFYSSCLDLLNEMSINSLLNRVAALAVSVSNACYCVCATNTDNEKFNTTVLYGFTPVELEMIRSANASGVQTEQIQADRPVLAVHGKDFPEAFNIFPDQRPAITSLLYVPIFYNNFRIGKVLLFNKIGATQFNENDRMMIEVVAAYTGFGINNAMIYDQIAHREEMLSKRNEDLALLNELAKISASTMDQLENIVDESMQHVMSYLDIEVGEFFLRDDENPDTLKMIFKQGHSFQTSLFGFSTPQFGQGIVGKTAQSRRPYVLSKAEIGVLNQKDATPVNLNYVVILPLIASDGVIGVSCLATKLVGESEIVNLQFLASITSWIATLIQDFQLSRERKRIAILEERERIGMDLHDGVIQSIYGVGLTLEHARLLTAKDPKQAAEKIQISIDALNATIRDIRSYIMNLKPARLTNENLVQSLRRLANDFYSNTLVNTTFDPNVENFDGLTEDRVNMFYMICKESLSNITKHAKASAVTITFNEEPSRFVLIVTDNGVGFDPQQDRKTSSHGINNMFARTRNLGGKLDITSRPGKGTRVEVWLPKAEAKGQG